MLIPILIIWFISRDMQDEVALQYNVLPQCASFKSFRVAFIIFRLSIYLSFGEVKGYLK